MKSLFSLAVGLLLALQARAGTFDIPAQKLVGIDQTFELGELVVLGVSPVTQKPANYVSTSYLWKLRDGFRGKVFQTAPAGDQIFFGAGIKAKTLLVECIATHLYLVKDASGVVKEAATQTVVMDGQVNIGEGPEPDPTPTPTPTPSFPDGSYQLSKFSYEQATNSVPGSSRQNGAAVLARSYRGVASAAQAGTIKTTAQFLAQTKQANDAALQQAGISAADWATFSGNLQDRLYTLYQNKQINTVADFAIAWNEIAAGLDKVK